MSEKINSDLNPDLFIEVETEGKSPDRVHNLTITRPDGGVRRLTVHQDEVSTIGRQMARLYVQDILLDSIAISGLGRSDG